MIFLGKSEGLGLLYHKPLAYDVVEPGFEKKNQIDHLAVCILRYNYEQAFGLLRMGRFNSGTFPENDSALIDRLSFERYSRESGAIWQSPDCVLKTGGGEQETLGVSGHLGNGMAGPRWAKTPLLDRMRARS